MVTHSPTDLLSLTTPAPGRPLRVVLLAFYNYESHALRIFHPLLKQRGHEVHSIFFKNYFTYQVPTQQEEDMVVDLVRRIQPDVVGFSVWSTYYQLAARISRRVKEAVDPVVIWGGIHPQTQPDDCLQHADIVCRSEGEYVLAELTDRLSQGEGYADLGGCWVRDGDEVRRNPPRMLIPSLDVLPPADMSSENKHYLGHNAWRDTAKWDSLATCYDVMCIRGCPFECTFCIHNFTRKATQGLGTYLRRRSVDHVMEEINAARQSRPNLRAIALSDDIFCPPRPWMEEFCQRYKKEVGLPFALYTYPRMVDEQKVRLLVDAGLWATTMGVQSGSERIRRDCYERETSNEEILESCRILANHGVVLNLDFIGDNPYENEDDRRQTIDLLTQLPKPIYFNYFSLTYFPGVDLTERALKDGFIRREDVEDVAQKGYHLWGISLEMARTPEQLRWDIAYTMAVHGFPRSLILRLLDSSFFTKNIHSFARLMRQIREVSRRKSRFRDRLAGRVNLPELFVINTNRDPSSPGEYTQPNFDNSPFSRPVGVIRKPATVELPVVQSASSNRPGSESNSRAETPRRRERPRN